MKKIITTLAFALLLCAESQAQSCNTGQDASKPAPDAKLISTDVMGNSRVTTWLVKKSAPDNSNNEFSVKYKVNISKFISSYDNNHTELVKLRAFMDELMANNENQIVRLAITGYASPDGSHSVNERLANARASDCCTYIKKEFPELAKIECTASGIASPWSATKGMVESSSIPMKSDVLKIVESDMSDTEIETKLRAMPSAWDYMKSEILPPMRCVEIHVVYNIWEKMVTRTQIRPQVVEDVMIQNNYYIIESRGRSELMSFENSAAPLDFEDCKIDRRKGHEKDFVKFKDRRRKAKMKDKMRGRGGRQKYLWKMW